MVHYMSPRSKIKVLLVDDHPIVREGLRSSLKPYHQIQIVGETSTAEECVKKTLELMPDVILLDINLPDKKGFEIPVILREKAPSTKILVLTAHSNKEYIEHMIKVGVSGYILKDITPKELVEAIEKVAGGQKYFSPVVGNSLINNYVKKAGGSGKSISLLSPREIEILKLVAEGHTNKEVASKLGISVRTVETHRERIMNKLNIHSTAGLTRFAISEGLVEL